MYFGEKKELNCEDTVYQVIRSERKTLALEITADLQVLVRSPAQMADKHIDRFVEENNSWIQTHLCRQRRRKEAEPYLTEEKVQQLKTLAKILIPQRVDYFGRIMGLEPAGVKITSAQKRYGSCSSTDQLCFSWRLMLYKSEIIDCIVIHELAHIRYKNHSAAFYKLVESYLPDYRQKMRVLKNNPASWLRQNTQ